jgi:glycosyltransferase involved in cell wall biosynthesis
MRVINIGRDVVPRLWDEQRAILGSALVYLNTTFDSPMPRGRTEAMLCGCCVLTTPFHDADNFVEHGVNGFVMGDDPMDWCDLVAALVGPRMAEAERIGRNARDTATRMFHVDRYLDDLWSVVNERLSSCGSTR